MANVNKSYSKPLHSRNICSQILIKQMCEFTLDLPASVNLVQIWWTKFATHLLSLQTWVNPFFRPVIAVQQLPTLLGVTYCDRLQTLLHVGAWSLKLVERLSQKLPTFFFFRDRQRVVNYIESVCTTLPTLLGPHTCMTYGLHGDSNALTCWKQDGSRIVYVHKML